jgi:hypothetical protein
MHDRQPENPLECIEVSFAVQQGMAVNDDRSSRIHCYAARGNSIQMVVSTMTIANPGPQSARAAAHRDHPST